MPQFMSKPRLITAEQYLGPNEVPHTGDKLPAPQGVSWEPRVKAHGDVLVPYVTTISGQRAYLATGNWIVPEAQEGRYYLLTAEVLQQNYNRVPGAESCTFSSKPEDGFVLKAGEVVVKDCLVKHPNLLGELTEALNEPIVTRPSEPEDPFPRKINRWVLKHEQFGTYYKADLVVIGKHTSVAEIELCTWYANEDQAGRTRDSLEPGWRVLPVRIGFSHRFSHHDPLPEHLDAERLNMQLAGVMVAAEGGTKDPVVAKQGQWGWSPAYQTVLELRRKYDAIAPLHVLDPAAKRPVPLRPHILQQVMESYGFKTRDDLRKQGDIANNGYKYQIAALIEEIFRITELYIEQAHEWDGADEEKQEADAAFLTALCRKLGCEQDYNIILETLSDKLRAPELDPDMPRRFKIRDDAIEGRKFPKSMRYGVYFPGTDLCINDMSGRGTGPDLGSWGEYIDPVPEHLAKPQAPA